jgi:hypothetical protein
MKASYALGIVLFSVSLATLLVGLFFYYHSSWVDPVKDVKFELQWIKIDRASHNLTIQLMCVQDMPANYTVWGVHAYNWTGRFDPIVAFYRKDNLTISFLESDLSEGESMTFNLIIVENSTERFIGDVYFTGTPTWELTELERAIIRGRIT